MRPARVKQGPYQHSWERATAPASPAGTRHASACRSTRHPMLTTQDHPGSKSTCEAMRSPLRASRLFWRTPIIAAGCGPAVHLLSPATRDGRAQAASRVRRASWLSNVGVQGRDCRCEFVVIKLSDIFEARRWEDDTSHAAKTRRIYVATRRAGSNKKKHAIHPLAPYGNSSCQDTKHTGPWCFRAPPCGSCWPSMSRVSHLTQQTEILDCGFTLSLHQFICYILV